MNASKIRMIIVLCLFVVFGSQLANATEAVYSGPGVESGSTSVTATAPVGTTLTVWGRPVGTWTDNKIFGFLAARNRSRLVLIRSLKVLQGKQPRNLYFQTGREEKRRNLKQRPILSRAPSQVPFSRGIEYVVRVDRRYGIDLEVELDFIAVKKKKSRQIDHTPINKIYVYTTPGRKEEAVLHSHSGRFTYTLPRKTHYKKILFQIRDGDERHHLTVRFIHYKKKVSFAD